MSNPIRERGPRGLLKRFARDRSGVSAVEFALIAPLMITMYFGLAEFCQGYMAQKRMGHSAAAVADLVAQTDVVTIDELEDIAAIGALIMEPFPAEGLTVRVSSVTRDADGDAKVDWSQASGTTPLGTGAVVTIPTDMIAIGESVVMAETTYHYISPIRYLLPNIVIFTSRFYSRPRRVDRVGCSDCPDT